MQSITISKKRFDGLKRLELPESVVSTEAVIYRFNYLIKPKVFKSLHKTKGPVFANKLFTLEMLNEYKDILPSSFVVPEALVAVEKEVKGFELPYIKGQVFESYLADRSVPVKDKIHYLKQIGEMLNQLSGIRKDSELDSIYINDLHASNFIVDEKDKQLKVVDLDSCRICDAKPFPARYLSAFSLLNHAPGDKYDIYNKKLITPDGIPIMTIMTQEEAEQEDTKYRNYRYELGYVNANEQSDLYCYVILFLNFLFGSNLGNCMLEEFYNYMYYLEKLDFDRDLLNAIHLIVSGAPNENIGPYLDSVTEEQVARAHQKVYKATRNKI